MTPELISWLCQRGWQRSLLTGMLRDRLTQHFQDGMIQEPILRQLIWRSDETTRILVEDLYRRRDALPNLRPALFIKPNAYQPMRQGINDVSGTTPEGDTEHAITVVGSHTVFCLSENALSADILSSEVFSEMTRFSPVMRSRLLLLKFQVTEVGEISLLEEARETFVVPVTIGWAYWYKWILRQEAPPLRQVRTDANF